MYEPACARLAHAAAVMFLVAASRVDSARGLPLSTQQPCAAYGPSDDAGGEVAEGAGAADVDDGAEPAAGE